MMSTTPQGWQPDGQLQDEAASLYAAMTGLLLSAQLYISHRMAGRTAGLFHPGPPPRIALSQRYLESCSLEERRDLLLHELAHYHLWRLGLRREGHGPRFHAIMRQWGFSRYPNVDIMRELRGPDTSARLLFVCPSGHEHWLRRRPKSEDISCGICSRHFDRRYLLRDTGVRLAPVQEPPRRSRS